MKRFVLGLFLVGFLAAPALAQELTFWDNGFPHLIQTTPTTQQYGGYTSGPSSSTTPQRWAAVPFHIDVNYAVITRITADFWFAAGTPTRFKYIIWNRSNAPMPNLDPPQTQFASGDLPVGPAMDDPRGPTGNGWMRSYDVNIPIPMGKYYFTIYACDDTETIGIYGAWYTAGDGFDPALEQARMYRCSTYPPASFTWYTVAGWVPLPPQVTADLYNCCFALYGVQNIPAACCTYVNGVGSCQVLDYGACTALGGVHHPEHSSCAGFVCPPEKTTDVSPSNGNMTLELYGQGTYTFDLSSACEAETIIERDAPPYPYPPNPGWNSIETEILELNLTGLSPIGPVVMSRALSPASPGAITNIVTIPGNPNNIASGDSFFDVYFEVTVPGLGALVNNVPVHLAAHIQENTPGAGALPADEHFLFQSGGGAACMGDVNGDTLVNGKDVQSFVSCVLAGGHSCPAADMNCNGTAGLEDVPAFVNALLSGSCGNPCGTAAIELFPKAGGAAVGKIDRLEAWASVGNQIYNQVYNGAWGISSDVQGTKVYDNFFAAGAITDLHWKGGICSPGPVACSDENPMLFEYAFYDDIWDGTTHAPGALKCGPYQVSAVGLPVGTLGSWGPLYEFAAQLPAPCTLGYGWVSIQGVGTGAPADCNFEWMDATGGDGLSYFGTAAQTLDWTFCVTGTASDATGGCCISDGGGGYTCQLLAWSECYAQHGQFKGPGTNCSGANPCTGACCYHSDLPGHTGWYVNACVISTADNCSALGNGTGVFQGPGTACTPDPCPPVLGACCIPQAGAGCSWCIEVTADDCLAMGGTAWRDVPCTDPTACVDARCGGCCVGTVCTVQSEYAPCNGTFYRDAKCDATSPCSGGEGVNDCYSAVPYPLAGGQTLNIFGDSTYSTNDCSALGADPEMWHAFIVMDSCEDVTIKLCGSSPEHTMIEIVLFTGCPCDSGIMITADEWDWTSCGAESNPRTLWKALQPGIYYYPVYGGFHAPYVGTISAAACTPACSPQVSCTGATHTEAEACGLDSNGGCNTTPNLFEVISRNETICGTAWAYNGARDTDWYQFTTTGVTTLTLNVTSELPVGAHVFSAVCPVTTDLLAAYADCNVPSGAVPLSNLPAGTYYLVVYTGTATLDIFGGYPCWAPIGNDYKVVLTTAP